MIYEDDRIFFEIALAGQDVFDSRLVTGDGSFHCFNKVGDAVFDLTSEQFDHRIEYMLDIPQKREIHFAKAEKKSRYEALKAMLMRREHIRPGLDSSPC